MQLDKTHIAIRERRFVDLLDLALRVIRAYAAPLAGLLVCGVAPAMALNAWLLAGYAEPGGDEPFPVFYLWAMLMLVVWETPLVTAPMTLLLGEALFTNRPRPGKIARDFLRSLPQLILYQVVIRGLMLPLVITWFVLFANWPYLSEVILLERNPLWRRRRGQMTTYRRTQALHGGFAGDLFARWLGAMGVGVLLFVTWWVFLVVMTWVLVSEWEWEGTAYTVYYPLALWLVGGYLTVVRFLAYLDLRIRREGWEVELMMRAEGARLSRQLT